MEENGRFKNIMKIPKYALSDRYGWCTIYIATGTHTHERRD